MTHTRYFSSIRRLAEQTPAERNRVVDLMRVVSILVVVFGHWLLAAVTIDGGELSAGHLLELSDWTHPLTWLFQVMPIFFFVGGYANALSWRSARNKSAAYGAWLRERMRRLALPVVPLLIVWGVGGWLAIRAGLDWEMLQLASKVALVPTWFLAAYVVIVTLTPPALHLWDRFGWWAIAGGLALAGLADVLAIAGGVVWVGFLNYLFVWGTVHMLGFAWVDGRFAMRSLRYLTLAGGFLVTLVLVWAGPYPVAMVGLDTAEVTNSYPPRVTLAFLGLFQAGLVLVLEPMLQRAASRRRSWTFVVGISALIMTLYLWHLTAMVIAIGISLALDGFGLGIEPLTTGWWLSRPLWFGVLGLLTICLMLVFGRFERPGRDPRPAPPWWRPVVAVLMVCAGLGFLAAIGIADADGLNGLILSLPVIGVVVGGVTRIPELRAG
jgi:surface polysaccharide O-acyltransferase-like enzyme